MTSEAAWNAAARRAGGATRRGGPAAGVRHAAGAAVPAPGGPVVAGTSRGGPSGASPRARCSSRTGRAARSRRPR